MLVDDAQKIVLSASSCYYRTLGPVKFKSKYTENSSFSIIKIQSNF